MRLHDQAEKAEVRQHADELEHVVESLEQKLAEVQREARAKGLELEVRIRRREQPKR